MPHEPATPDPGPETQPPSAKDNGWRTFGIIIITVIITLGVVYWLAATYLFPDAFTPVVLDERDEQQLEHKLQRLGGEPQGGSRPGPDPEPYSETGADREVAFSEKEINALLARNTNLADRLAIDLSENLASATLLVELPPDFPVLGSRIVRVTGGMELLLEDGRPVARLKGISIWGVPMPNAWLGNMKNVDLFRQAGSPGGFWQAVGEGIESIRVEEGKLYIRLRE